MRQLGGPVLLLLAACAGSSAPPPPPPPAAAATPTEPPKVAAATPPPAAAPNAAPALAACGDLRACYLAGKTAFDAQDFRTAADHFEAACGLGHLPSCAIAAECLDDPRRAYTDFERSARLYDKACVGGVVAACSNLAIQYKHGRGVSQDYAEAARLWRIGCDAGLGGACTDLGGLHKRGLGVDKDLAAAARLWERGCALGHTWSCTNLGIAYHFGQGVTVDFERAEKLYRGSCEQDYGPGCRGLGALLLDEAERGAVVDRSAEGVAALERSCNLQDGDGCFMLGKLREGEQQATLMKRGCDFGSTLACRALGMPKGALTSIGTGTTKNVLESLRNECDGDEGGSCTTLGRLYRDGAEGIDKDPKRAQALFVRGCKLGAGSACANAARMLAGAHGIPADRVEGERYARRACETLDDVDNCAILAWYLYETGKGADGHRLLESSCKRGAASACEMLEQIDKKSPRRAE